VALWANYKSRKMLNVYKQDNDNLEHTERELSKGVNELRDHIRKQDAVMAQLTEENKKLKLQNNHSVSLLKEWLDQAVKFEVEIKNLEQANATQAKSFQTLLNKNNALHRELKLAKNTKPIEDIAKQNTPEEYYDIITEINKGDVFLCVEWGGQAYTEGKTYTSQLDGTIQSNRGNDNVFTNPNYFFKKIKPKA